jgi:hypothetical protein
MESVTQSVVGLAIFLCRSGKFYWHIEACNTVSPTKTEGIIEEIF